MNKSTDVFLKILYFTAIIVIVAVLTGALAGCGDDSDQERLDELELQVAALQQENQDLKNAAVAQSATKTKDAVPIDTHGELVATSAWSISYELEQWIALRIQDAKSWARSEEVMSAGQGLVHAEKARKYLGDEIINIPEFEDAYIVDLFGKLITDEIGYTEPDIQSEGAAWRMGREHGLYVSDLYLPREGFSTQYRMDVAVLVEDITTAKPMGILVCTIQLYPASLGQEYETQFPGQQVLIFEKTGSLIVDTDDDKRYLEEVPVWSSLEQQVIDKITNNTRFISPDYLISDSVIAGYARAANQSVDTRIPGFDGLGWTVMFVDEVEVLQCQ